MLNISTGKIPRAQKVVIYDAEGIGKTSLTTKFPNPLIIDTEGGTAHLDVRRIDRPQSWDELIAIVDEVAGTAGVCGTLVLDTADWAEQLCINHICTKYKQPSIESFGYGKGFTYVGEEFSRLLESFDKVIRAGIHVVITAHAKMRKFEQPDEMGAYDRWEMKLSRQAAPLLKEWADLVLFCNYQTYVVTAENKSQKAQGGKRVMYTSHHPCWDAKNRHNLPDMLDLDFSGIAHIFAAAEAPEFSTMKKLKLQMLDAHITSDSLLQFIKGKGHCAEAACLEDIPESFLTGWVLKYWPNIVSNITAGTAQQTK